MNTPHTPGPWYADGDHVVKHDYAQDIICVPPRGDAYRRPYEEARANACLIAAAPDLLAALARLVDFVSALDEFPEEIEDAHEQARAAIAKAKGES